MIREFKLDLERRTDLGKRASRTLRKEGKIPGIFYSAMAKAIPFTIDRKHLHHALQSESHVYAISVGGKKLHAIFKELQYHPVTEEIIHVDLYGISLKDRIDIVVPIVLEGESKGAKAGGIMTQNITDLQVHCLATEVPDAVHIDVTDLEIGESIHVRNLDLGEVEILTNPEITIVSVQVPRAAIVEEKVEEVTVAEAEEAEEVEESKKAEPEKEETGGGEEGSSE